MKHDKKWFPADEVLFATPKLDPKLRARATCDVCWGSHGCERPRGHRGHHFCCGPMWLRMVRSLLPERVARRVAQSEVGCWPYYGRRETVFYGEDVDD